MRQGITSKEAFRAGNLARANGNKKSSNPYVCSDAHLAEQWDAGWLAHSRIRKPFPGTLGEDTNVLTPLQADPNCREYHDGHLGHANGIDRTQNPYAASNCQKAHQWNAGWEAHARNRNGAAVNDEGSWPFEESPSRGARFGSRLRSSVFYWGGLVTLIVGIGLLYKDLMAGGFLVLTLAPCLFLYPVIRFLFGGKGGVVPSITTIVVEEVLKHKAIDSLSRRSRRR